MCTSYIIRIKKTDKRKLKKIKINKNMVKDSTRTKRKRKLK
jgi:hypothetical protein